MAEAGKGRRANFELLRILAMIMVVIMHFLSHSGRLLSPGESADKVKIAGSLLEAFCLVAVNVYVLLSGYFGVRSSFKPSKAVGLLCRIWFYALLIPLVLSAMKASGLFPAWEITTEMSEKGVYGLIQYFFPIETEHYWFATSYFMLYLLTPVLNAAAGSMSKRQFQIVLGGLLILFSGIKSFSPVAFAFDNYGYDLPWFICVYLTAAYLSLHGSELFEKRGWYIYTGSCLAGFGINAGMYVLCRRSGLFEYYFTVPYHYNFILCLAGAVGLLYGFSGLSIKEGYLARLIRRLGTLSFGVYLFHEHIDLRGRWYDWICAWINPQKEEGVLFFLWELFFCTLILFAGGIFIDWIRSILFERTGAFLGKTGLSLKLRKLDGYFAFDKENDR